MHQNSTQPQADQGRIPAGDLMFHGFADIPFSSVEWWVVRTRRLIEIRSAYPQESRLFREDPLLLGRNAEILGARSGRTRAERVDA
jgi:hypothetical protein